MNQFNHSDDEHTSLQLDKEDQELLILYAQGAEYEEMAEKMGLSSREAIEKLAIILEKLHIDSRAQAERWVSIFGLSS